MRGAIDPAGELTFNATGVARALMAVAILLVVGDTGAMLLCYALGRSPPDVRLAQFFYLDGERNLPTAFSTFLLLLAAAILTLIACLERRWRHRVVYWAVLALGFTLMAIDEAWAFHERLTVPMRQALGNRDPGIFYDAWVVPALALLLLLALFFVRFLLGLPSSTRLRFLVAGVVYVGGAVGIELIEGRFVETHGDRNLTFGTISTIEETMEMVGVILFIRALLAHLAETVGELRIRFGGLSDRGEPGGGVRERASPAEEVGAAAFGGAGEVHG